MKKFLPLLILLHFIPTTFASFTDVAKDFHQYKSINWLQQQGVVQGYKDGSFQPEKPVSRAEFLKMLYETKGMENYDVDLPFPDIPKNAWYTKYVKEAYYTGVVEGYPDGTFGPESQINLAEALKIVTAAFLDIDKLSKKTVAKITCGSETWGTDALDSSDTIAKIDQDAWYYKYLSTASSLCILSVGYNANGSGGLWMDGYVDRGDMAEILYRTKTVADSNNQPYTADIVPLTILNDTYISTPNSTGKIEIVGDSDCMTKTTAALKLIKEKDPKHYEYIRNYVGIIECADQGSGMFAWETPPKYKVGSATMNAGTPWYAGTIVHDSCHSMQYNDYLAKNPNTYDEVPMEVYYSKNSEQECLDIQYDSLVEMEAEQSTLDAVKDAINTNYWEVDYEDRWW